MNELDLNAKAFRLADYSSLIVRYLCEDMYVCSNLETFTFVRYVYLNFFPVESDFHDAKASQFLEAALGLNDCPKEKASSLSEA